MTAVYQAGSFGVVLVLVVLAVVARRWEIALGLTAAGVSEADATAAVFIQRLFTSYLPPIWGSAVLVWTRKKECL